MNGSKLKDKLLVAGLDKESFSRLTNTPISTINEWSSKRNGKYKDCPNWVESYLNLYIKNRDNEIYIKKLIEELKRGSDSK
jgi:hypothetical protein